MGLAAVAPGLALPLSARMTAKSEVEEGHFFTYLWALEGVLATMCSISATITSLKRDGERERERVSYKDVRGKQAGLTHLQSPHKHRGGLRGRGASDTPHAPMKKRERERERETERERERETYLAILAQAVSASRGRWPLCPLSLCLLRFSRGRLLILSPPRCHMMPRRRLRWPCVCQGSLEVRFSRARTGGPTPLCQS